MSIKNISRFLLLFLVISVISFSVACSSSDSSESTDTADSADSDSSDEDTADEDTTDEDTAEEDSEVDTEDSETSEAKVFTEDELATYNGKDGNDAYVAIDGVVYDVTNAEGWSEGEHKDGVKAGQDLTDELGSSPHGDSVLGGLTVVGNLE